MRFLKAWWWYVTCLCVCVFGVETFRIILKRKRQLARQSFFSARSLWCRTAYKLQNITWAMKGEMKRGIYNIIFKFQATWTTKTEEKKSFMNIILLGVLVFAACQRKNVNGMCENLGETFNRIDSNWILFRSHAWVCVCDECAEWTRYAEVRRTGQSGSPTCLRNIFCA